MSTTDINFVVHKPSIIKIFIKEKLKRRATALLGTMDTLSDALIYSQSDVDQMMKDHGHSAHQPARRNPAGSGAPAPETARWHYQRIDKIEFVFSRDGHIL